MLLLGFQAPSRERSLVLRPKQRLPGRMQNFVRSCLNAVHPPQAALVRDHPAAERLREPSRVTAGRQRARVVREPSLVTYLREALDHIQLTLRQEPKEAYLVQYGGRTESKGSVGHGLTPQ